MIDRAWQRNLESVFEPIFDTDDPVLEKFTNYANRLADGLTESLKSTGHVAGCRYGNFAVELSTRDPVIRERSQRHSRRSPPISNKRYAMGFKLVSWPAMSTQKVGRRPSSPSWKAIWFSQKRRAIRKRYAVWLAIPYACSLTMVTPTRKGGLIRDRLYPRQERAF